MADAERSRVLIPPIGEQDHRIGPRDAPLQLVEFGDFECPFCGEAFPVVKQILGIHGAELLFVFRHFPLVNQHPHALRAAEAAEAAGRQGLFWEMHDLLFENQSRLEDDDIRRYAGAAGCELDRFEMDWHSEEVRERVRVDGENGVRSGVLGTPTFFVNGVLREGILSFEEITAALSEVRTG
jgi:protein-disulfide isomerase